MIGGKPRYQFTHQVPVSEPPPSRFELLRRKTASFFTRFRLYFFAIFVIFVAVAAILIYDAFQPEPQRLTQEDIDTAVEKSLESAPPMPSFAILAYEVIRPSLVLVRTLSAQSAGIPDGGPQDGESQGGDPREEGDPQEGDRREEGDSRGDLPQEDRIPQGTVGAGVVIIDDGTILTSLHVVQDAAVVLVTFADGLESQAEVVVRQPENDLAVLKALLIPDDLVPATLTSTAMLRVGDDVVAVGHPFGIPHSVSAGVVSGLRRSYAWPEIGQALTNLIQFDAAVNPGNSGGPLVNRLGEVVGIVTALLNPAEQDFFVGIGFAVPIETAAAATGPPLW